MEHTAKHTDVAINPNEHVDTQATLSSTLIRIADDANVKIALTLDGVGKVTTLFVGRDRVIDADVVFNSGYIRAVPPGQGLGTKLLKSLERVLQTMANDTGCRIIHPLSPTSEESAKLFKRVGYEPYQGYSQNWVYADSNTTAYVKVFNPSSANPSLSSDEAHLLSLLKQLEAKAIEKAQQFLATHAA